MDKYMDMEREHSRTKVLSLYWGREINSPDFLYAIFGIAIQNIFTVASVPDFYAIIRTRIAYNILGSSER